MKLFITNKDYFEESFTRKDYRGGYYATPKEIHKRAFNQLQSSIANNNIPIILYAEYKDFGDAIFEFKSKKGDIYFYEYIHTAS